MKIWYSLEFCALMLVLALALALAEQSKKHGGGAEDDLFLELPWAHHWVKSGQ